MSILGFRTMPTNHRLHRVYRLTAGVVGVLLVAFGLVGLVLDTDRLLGIATGTGFCVGCLIAGAVLIGAALAGGNVAAQVNAWTGAILIVLGLAGLILVPQEDANLDLEVSNVIVMFVVGITLLAAGFYGQVGAEPFGADRGHAGS